MGDVIKLDTGNINSMDWTVEEALEYALETVRSSTMELSKVYIALCGQPEEGRRTANMQYIMSGMHIPEAIGWLYLHMDFLASDDD